ncbi:MAG: SprT-like domain-containing protein [Bacteroidota bacterium]|nr:SprT-like domain-containing protein [Bacteroidota bacterium]
MQINQRYKEIISRYVPETTVDIVLKWVIENKIFLKISKERKTKLGDYCPPTRNANHKISVNYNLNKYAFLITFVHELAHLFIWEKYQNRVKPHGEEWQKEFLLLMTPLLKQGVFPKDIQKHLEIHLQKGFASSHSDLSLLRILNKYDKNPKIVLESLPDNARFRVPDGREFIKQKRIKKRFSCLCVNSKRIYSISPMASVISLPNDKEII